MPDIPQPHPQRPGDVDPVALERDLARAVDGEVRFDTGSRALYTTDASNYRQVPYGVVIPYSVEGIARTIGICRRHRAPVLTRGGGTALAGQTCNTAVVIDTSKYVNRVLSVDAAGRRAAVEPGCVLDDLRRAVRPHGLTFAPDPATHDHCTLGGMIGNNSGGVHSVMGGLTADNVDDLEVVTYRGDRLTVGALGEDGLARRIKEGGVEGDLYRRLKDLRDGHAQAIRDRFPDIPRRVSGYNLPALLPENGFHVARSLVGSEGTCVAVLRATLLLVPLPPHRVLLVVGFEDIACAADFVPRLRTRGHSPMGIEGIDDRLARNLRAKHLHEKDAALLPKGDSWLLVEYGGDTPADAEAKARATMADLSDNRHVQDIRLFTDPDEQERLWMVRESGLGATAFVPGRTRDSWPGWEDSAVGMAELGDYLRDLRALYDKYGYDAAMYGHFGDGLVHSRVDFGLRTEEEIARYRRFLFEAADLVVRHGGSLSGEHGDGLARSELLAKMFGPDIMRAFRAFKAIWDPDGGMNPGRIVDPLPLDSHLRMGPRYDPPKLDTHFRFPDDRNSFAHAALRCVGVGKCRRKAGYGGTMCPSYRATLEERHSTRGRARLLQEMMLGDPVTDGWKSEAVHDALDLCLCWKGCKSECPVNVDMATYKAEFLSHHYRHHRRPRAAYTMGLIHRWVRILAPVPWLPNLGTRTPGLGRLARLAAGIHPDRPVPRFAPRGFRRDFRPHAGDPAKVPVILWADSFNDAFSPWVLHAAARVLAATGHPVDIQARGLCCGRPLYDYGWLDAAKRHLLRIMDGLNDRLDAGAVVVGVEPSCLNTFRDELLNLFPDDPRAKRLSERSLMFSEFLERVHGDVPWPAIGRPAAVHVHCHHKAVIGTAADESVLARAGLAATILDDGCCGMAGAFGYETHKYPVSMTIARAGVLPAVEAAVEAYGTDTLVIADGFSCREQINQSLHTPNAPRRAVTLPEVLAAAMGRGGDQG